MFEEIQFLKESLTSSRRGEAVSSAKIKVKEIIDVKNWQEAEAYFREYADTFDGDNSVLNILLNEFQNLVFTLMGINSDFATIMILNHLSNLPWFDKIEESEYKRGYVAEKMAPFGQGVVEILKLQEARNHYRKAHKGTDETRVQEILSTKVKSFTWAHTAPTNLKNPALAKLRQMVADGLKTWQAESNQNRMCMLASDSFSIRPSPYREQAPKRGQDPFLTGFLEQVGVIQTVGLSSDDGRVDGGRMAPPMERIHFQSFEQIILTFLEDFAVPVKEWLMLDEGENKIFQLLAGSLKKNLAWDENSIAYFMEGVIAWVSGYPQVTLSFWLPFFESVLRNRLSDLGEDIINPQPRPGIENFVMFETLLNKAEKHYEERTVEYWRLLLSTRNGLGWNLRNEFCHGLLPLTVLKQDIYAFAVLLAYLFLLYPQDNTNAE